MINWSTNKFTLRWRHNERDSVPNHQPHDCLFNRLFRRRSKNTSKLRVTGLCAGNSPGTGEFPAQMASYAENVSIWWRHHVYLTPVPVFSHESPGLPTTTLHHQLTSYGALPPDVHRSPGPWRSYALQGTHCTEPHTAGWKSLSYELIHNEWLWLNISKYT